MSSNVAPPSLDDCHCTVGDGSPSAAAVKVTKLPCETVCASGCTVTAGADSGEEPADHARSKGPEPSSPSTRIQYVRSALGVNVNVLPGRSVPPCGTSSES